MTPRRELTLAVGAAVLAGALGLLAGARPWVDLQVVRDAPLPPADATVSGGTVSALVPGVALVVLAAAAGLVATRRWGRTAIGGLVLVAGVAILVAAVPWLGEAAPERARALATAVDLPGGDLAAAGRDGPYVAVLAGGLAVVAGALSAVRSRRWPAMGARYDAPTARPRAVEPAAATDPSEPAPATAVSDRAVWDALDRGEDPTTGR